MQTIGNSENSISMTKPSAKEAARGERSEQFNRVPFESTPKVDPTPETNESDRNGAFTIFSIPKPFLGPTALIQVNAINSWKRLHPEVEIILIGDDHGVAEYAERLNVGHLPQNNRNRYGTPLLSSAFVEVSASAKWSTVVYCNCDVILLADFFDAVHCLQQSSMTEFLAFGRRYDLSVDRELNFDDRQDINWLERELLNSGRPASIVCKEFFIFNRHQFSTFPDFAVGRGNWDNWMVHHSKQNGIPVIDISQQARVIHQDHDYRHLNQIKSDGVAVNPSSGSSVDGSSTSTLSCGSAVVPEAAVERSELKESKKSRWNCYVVGEEARENQRLAGGRHIITGSTPTWVLSGGQLKRVKWSGLNLRFFGDLPRFLWLSWELLTSR